MFYSISLFKHIVGFLRMYRVELKNILNRTMSLFYYLKLWHRDDETTIGVTIIKSLYCIYHLLFPISLMAGAITNDDTDESILLAEISINCSVMSVKVLHIIWKKKEILEMLNRCCVYIVGDQGEFTLVNSTLRKFEKFIVILLVVLNVTGIFITVVSPCLGSERKLFLNVAFPLDWKNDRISYWIVNAFLFTEVFFSTLTFSFSVIIWYLLINCDLRYKIVGNQLRNMGRIKTEDITVENKHKTLDKEKKNIFCRDLIAVIDSYQQMREYLAVKIVMKF